MHKTSVHYFLIVLCFFQYLTSQSTNLVITLMVKNEASVIQDTLQPFINAGCDTFLIYDTGSDDGTPEIVKELFESNQISDYQIIIELFIDFSTSRNKALRYTEEYFPEKTFMLMPDAEWYITGAEFIIEFCKYQENTRTEIYDIKIISGELEFYTPRLLRMHKNISFLGKVHEVPLSSVAHEILPNIIYFDYSPIPSGIEKTHARWKRDLVVLEEEYKNNPHDPRTAFYLAQTYECLGMLEDAFFYYEKRAIMNGWDEENYITWYRKGRVATELYKQQDDEVWLSQAIYCYQYAWNMRPKRIEAAVDLADLYIQENQMLLAYIILKEIFDYPYPSDDILFIEKNRYTFKRYELLSICAWYVNDYFLGKKAALKALLSYPELQYLHRNLALYSIKLES